MGDRTKARSVSKVDAPKQRRSSTQTCRSGSRQVALARDAAAAANDRAAQAQAAGSRPRYSEVRALSRSAD